MAASVLKSASLVSRPMRVFSTERVALGAGFGAAAGFSCANVAGELRQTQAHSAHAEINVEKPRPDCRGMPPEAAEKGVSQVYGRRWKRVNQPSDTVVSAPSADQACRRTTRSPRRGTQSSALQGCWQP